MPGTVSVPASWRAQTANFGLSSSLASRSPPHRHAARVALLDEGRVATEIVSVVVAAEEAHRRPGAARAVGLAPLHRREEGVAGVLLGPEDREAPGVELEVVGEAGAGAPHAGTAVAHRRVLGDQTGRAEVRIGTRDDPVLERVHAEFAFELEALLQCLADHALARRAQLIGELEIAETADSGEAVVGQLLETTGFVRRVAAEQALAVALVLHDLDQGLPALTQAGLPRHRPTYPRRRHSGLRRTGTSARSDR